MVGAGMTKDPLRGSGQSGDAAVQAFDDVRAEVALLRRAIERLSAERSETSESVDYSETLGGMSNAITGIAQRGELLAKSPALSLTPETLGSKIANAASAVRNCHCCVSAGGVADEKARQMSARGHACGDRSAAWPLAMSAAKPYHELARLALEKAARQDTAAASPAI